MPERKFGPIDPSSERTGVDETWKVPAQELADALDPLEPIEPMPALGLGSSQELSQTPGPKRGRDYWAEQRAREPVIRALLPLGFTHREVATAIGCSMAAVGNDIRHLCQAGAIEALRTEATPGQLFRAQLHAYAQLRLQLGDFVPELRTSESQQDRLINPDVIVYRALEDKLGIKGWITELDTLGQTIERLQMLRAEDPKHASYINLLHECFGSLPLNHVSTGEQLVKDYVAQIGDAHDLALEAQVPDTASSLLEGWKQAIERQSGGPAAYRLPLTEDDISSIGSLLTRTLSHKESFVLKQRFGLDGQPPGTLEGIGLQRGVSRERIRQIEAKALRKLRHPARRLSRFTETIGDRIARLQRESADRVNVRISSTAVEAQAHEELAEELAIPIETLSFSVRTDNALRRAGILSLGVLLKFGIPALMKLKNFGQRSLDEVKEKLAGIGYMYKQAGYDDDDGPGRWVRLARPGQSEPATDPKSAAPEVVGYQEDAEDEGPGLAEGMQAFYEAKITELRTQLSQLTGQLQENREQESTARDRQAKIIRDQDVQIEQLQATNQQLHELLERTRRSQHHDPFSQLETVFNPSGAADSSEPGEPQPGNGFEE